MSGYSHDISPAHAFTGQGHQYPDPEASQSQNLIWPTHASTPAQDTGVHSLDNARAEFAAASTEQRNQRREQVEGKRNQRREQVEGVDDILDMDFG